VYPVPSLLMTLYSSTLNSKIMPLRYVGTEASDTPTPNTL
jgi:hypothetical protein